MNARLRSCCTLVLLVLLGSNTELRAASGVDAMPAQAAGAAPGNGADPLAGRLFHSAAERAALDRGAAAVVPRPAPPIRRLNPPVAPERSPALTGFVLRSDGRDSYWLESPPPAEPLSR